MQKTSIIYAQNLNSLMWLWGGLSIFLLLNEQREREKERYLVTYTYKHLPKVWLLGAEMVAQSDSVQMSDSLLHD